VWGGGGRAECVRVQSHTMMDAGCVRCGTKGPYVGACGRTLCGRRQGAWLQPMMHEVAACGCVHGLFQARGGNVCEDKG
jgi:hypothetical protein